MTLRAGGIADINDFVIVEDTSIGTAATNFSTTEMVARTTLGGRLVHVHLLVNTTNTLTATSGNLTDVTCFTLDAAYRPSEQISCGFGNGSVSGECTINTNGVVNLRAASDSVAAGTNIRIHATFITA